MLRQSSCRSQRLTRTHAQPLFWVRSNALATKQHGKQQNEFTHIGEGCSQCWPAFDVAAPLANAAEMVDDVWFRNPNQFLAERSADPPVQLMGVAQSYSEASDAHLPIQQCHPNGSAAGLCRLRDESGLSLAVPERWAGPCPSDQRRVGCDGRPHSAVKLLAFSRHPQTASSSLV